MATPCRSRAELWLAPVELACSDGRRIVADLQDPDGIRIVEQELVDGTWQTRAPVTLTRAALERLMIAVSFR